MCVKVTRAASLEREDVLVWPSVRTSPRESECFCVCEKEILSVSVCVCVCVVGLE